MRSLRFGSIRYGRPGRIVWLGRHKPFGVAVLASRCWRGFWSWRARASSTPGRCRSLTAEAAEPDMKLGFMAFPGNDFAGPAQFVAFMRGDGPLTSRLLAPLLIDAAGGQVLDCRELPGYVSALLLAKSLHFGDYGGLPLKLAWVLLDVACIALIASGIYVWLKAGATKPGGRASPSLCHQPKPWRQTSAEPPAVGAAERGPRLARIQAGLASLGLRTHKPQPGPAQIWGMPAALGLASLGGLAATLFLDGVGDTLSSTTLGLPVAVLLYHLLRRRHRPG